MENEITITNMDRLVENVSKSIDLLDGITTKVDYPEEYIKGYHDACVAIKNTLVNEYTKLH